MGHRSIIFILTALTALNIGTPAHAQWTEPVRIGPPGAYLYPRILAAGDTLHVVGTLLPGGDKVVYLRSDDAGDSWGDSHVLSDTVNSTNAMFAKILKHNEQIMVLWRSIMNSGPGPWNIAYALSGDIGDTWTEPLYVLLPGWDHVSYFGASHNEQVVSIILSAAPDNEMVFYSIRSTDFGQSWSQPVELFRAAQGGRPDQAASGSIVHHVWSGRYNLEDKIEIFYMRSTDDGISWSPSIGLSDSDQHHSQLPAIAADDLGNVAVTWMDFKFAPPGATGDIFLRKSADSGSYWTAEEQLTFDHNAFGSDIVLKSDTIRIAWEDESQGLLHRKIFYIESTDNGASWSEQYWIDETDDDSWNPALAASNGRVYVVWADDRCDPDTDVCGGIYFRCSEQPTPIPTLSKWGMLVLALLLVAVGTLAVVTRYATCVKVADPRRDGSARGPDRLR